MPKRKKQSRRNYTAEQKAIILRRHLADKVPVSDLCDEYKVQPSVFYNWLRVALQNLQGALERQAEPGKPPKRERELERKLSALQDRVAKKDAVIAEIGEEYVKLKKELGEL